MAFGVALGAASIIGLIYGIINKNKALAIISIIMMILIMAVGVYFYNNPY